MTKLHNSLQTKLTLSFVFLILTISGLAFFYTYGETKKALKETLRDELKAIASVVAVQIDGDAMISLKPGAEETKEFKKMRDILLKVQKSHPDIKYIYTYTANDSKSVKFLVDAMYGMPGEDGADAAAIGEEYADITPEMMEGLSKTTADKTFTEDKWGTFMSGYSPILNSKGVPVAAVGVDMLSTKVLEKQDFLGSTIFFIIGMAVIVAGLIILMFSATIIRDIQRLNHIAENVSTGKIDEDVNIKRNDEIGELAESFQRMIMSLRIMRMYPDDKKDK